MPETPKLYDRVALVRDVGPIRADTTRAIVHVYENALGYCAALDERSGHAREAQHRGEG